MLSTYILFKFIHVVAAIVWIGGALALSVLQVRLAQAEAPGLLLAVSKHAEFVGRALVGPSALLTLVAGIVMVATSGLSFGAFWISWGFVGIVVSMGLGGGLGRRVQGELLTLLATDHPDPARVDALQRRLTLVNVLTLLVLLSVVWAMVYKPTL